MNREEAKKRVEELEQERDNIYSAWKGACAWEMESFRELEALKQENKELKAGFIEMEVCKKCEELKQENHEIAQGFIEFQKMYRDLEAELKTIKESILGVDVEDFIYKYIDMEIHDYKLNYQFSDDAGHDNLCLVDVLTPDGDKDISRGQKEITYISENITDTVAEAIKTKLKEIVERVK